MPRLRKLLVLVLCVTVGFASSASAATLRILGAHAFYRPPMTSESDLRALVKNRSADLKKGFTKAGYPDLFPAFMEQFPTAKIEAITVAPGERFPWMLFKRNGTGRVAVAKDLTWGGASSFDAYRFEIVKDGKRYVFVVPLACGNVALRDVALIPPPPAPVAAAPAPPPPAPVAAAPAPPPPPPVTAAPAPPPAPAPVAVAPPPPPPARVPPPVAAVPAPPPPAPVPAPVAVAPPPPPPAARFRGGPVVDVGFCHQPDPADYVFARVGYEIRMVERLYLLGLVGGFGHVGNDVGRYDGENAFVADLLLDYHWWHRLSFETGAGYWSGHDGHVDLIAGAGVLLFGQPEAFNGTVFLEGRSFADDLEHLDDNGRIGLGLRFRF